MRRRWTEIMRVNGIVLVHNYIIPQTRHALKRIYFAYDSEDPGLSA